LVPSELFRILESLPHPPEAIGLEMADFFISLSGIAHGRRKHGEGGAFICAPAPRFRDARRFKVAFLGCHLQHAFPGLLVLYTSRKGSGIPKKLNDF
jgi:hypothetical protein